MVKKLDQGHKTKNGKAKTWIPVDSKTQALLYILHSQLTIERPEKLSAKQIFLKVYLFKMKSHKEINLKYKPLLHLLH